MSEPVLYLFEVSHPDFPTVIVPSIGPDSATVEAARRWGRRVGPYCRLLYRPPRWEGRPAPVLQVREGVRETWSGGGQVPGLPPGGRTPPPADGGAAKGRPPGRYAGVGP